MKARAGVFVLGLAGVFFVGVLVVTLARRHKPPDKLQPVSTPLPAPVIAESPSEPVEIANAPEAEAPALRIEVVDGASNPVEGARAVTRWHMGTSLGTTDESGLMTIPFAAVHYGYWGESTVRIEHTRFSPQFVNLRRSVRFFRVILKPSAFVDVEVVNTLSHPLADAEVQVDEMDAWYWSPPYMKRSWKTGDRGHVRVTGIPFGALVIRAQARGYEEGDLFIVAHEGEPRTAKLILTQGRVLSVTVRSGGAPVPDAKVEFSDGSTWGASTSVMGGYKTRYWTRQTDKDGAASFDSVPSSMKEGWLRVKSRTMARFVKHLKLTEASTDIEVILEPGATLIVDVVDPMGRSVPCSVGVSGKEMNWSPEPQATKAAGSKATFEGLPTASPLSLTLSRDNACFHYETGIVLSPSETRLMTIKVPNHCRVRLSSRDQQGLPVPGRIYMMRVKGALGPRLAGITSDYLCYEGTLEESGTSEFEVLVGIYKVTLVPREGARVEKEVRIEQDEDVDLEVVSSVSMAGLIVDAAGHPVPGVRIQWYEEKGNWLATSGADGRFTLNRLVGGSGRLNLVAGGVMLAAYAGPPAVGELRLVFPMSTLRGKVVRSDGNPGWGLVHAFPVSSPGFQASEGNMPVSTKRDGTFEMRLPSGRWQVSIYAEGGTHEPPVFEVDLSAPGNMVDRVFTLAPPAK